MKDEKPTYEELLKWHDESENEYKVMEVLKSFVVFAGMATIFMFIEQFARIGAATVFEAWKLSSDSILSCNAFLQIGITVVYVYMAWHFIMMILFTYKEDINKFDDKWKAFKAWCKKEKESTPEVNK